MSGKLRPGFLLLPLALVVVVWLLLGREEPVPVTLAVADLGPVEATVANTRAGSVKACRRARLSPMTGGQIARLYVQEGDRVERDQILLELWNQDLDAQLELAQNEYQAARSAMRQRCLLADEAQRDARRLEVLLQRGLAAEDRVDEARTNAAARRAACEASQAQVQVQRARIDVAQAALERTRLRAPFAGTIAEINGELSEYITPSPVGVATPPAVDLIDDSCLYVSAPIDEVDAPAIRPAMDARIVLDAFPGRSFPALVQRIAPYVQEKERQARTVEVEAVFRNPADFAALLPGYSADVEIILARRDEVLRIPSEAILQGGPEGERQAARVLVYDRDSGLLEERRIETGLANWQYTEVRAGLTAGEAVVLSIEREGVAAGVKAVPENSLALP